MKQQISLSELHAITRAALIAAGASEAAAKSVANSITNAERDGSVSHGFFRLPGYIASLESGKVNGFSEPEISAMSAGVICCDAKGGLAPYALDCALPLLIKATKASGIAALVVRNSAHFSSLWQEVEVLSDAGLVGIACTTYLPAVAPFGAKEKLFGTNPLAFAWPRPDAPPLVFDMATAAKALGDVQLAAQHGETLAPGIGQDKFGMPSVDPQEVLEGSLLPFGGYKGAALSLMIELLAGALLGQKSSISTAEGDNGDGGPPPRGELIIGIDPDLFSGGIWREEAEKLLMKLKSQQGLRLPGERRHARRMNAGKVSIDSELMAKMRQRAGL
jgi:delta1-piperideine-2-carboxylate reductase